MKEMCKNQWVVNKDKTWAVCTNNFCSFMMTSSNGNIFRMTGICAGNSLVTGEFPPHKGQSRGALMFSLMCTWMNGWVNNHEAGDLRCHRTRYEVTVMYRNINTLQLQDHLLTKLLLLVASKVVKMTTYALDRDKILWIAASKVVRGQNDAIYISVV